MLKVIAKNYYTREDYRFLEQLLRNGFIRNFLRCDVAYKNCTDCANKRACKDIKQLIDYLHTINK